MWENRVKNKREMWEKQLEKGERKTRFDGNKEEE